jgi:hypothetical protein
MGAATTTEVISFSCGECGRTIRCPASYAGKTARCPGCKQAVRAPAAGATPRPKAEPRRPATPLEVARSAHATRVSRQIDNTQLTGGLLAMGGAVVWFVVGLQANVIFLYAPVLFVVGLGTVIRVYAGGQAPPC